MFLTNVMFYDFDGHGFILSSSTYIITQSYI